MKKFYFIFCVLISLIYNAQLDTEHYFAPMYERQTNGSLNNRLYLSTNEVAPFQVQIYNNETVFATVSVAKGAPVEVDIPRNFMITRTTADLFTPRNMGIKAIGSKKFFANFRFNVTNHAEIITSKGKAGLGTTFYAAFAPQSVNSSALNFTCSVLATEDNTQVTFSGASPGVVYNSTTPIIMPLTITLNKGQSYIIEGDSRNSNWSGFIGTKIVANKPISVTNGNFNGQYADTTFIGSDILMDQSVPTERLGNEFVVVKGTSIGHDMERVLVVSTQNNTQVFLNGNPVPVATLNEGQFYFMPESAFQLKGGNHYNVYIKTTNNAYVYQMLAGTNGSSISATGGFNYIPPLNCYLPKKIDEISKVNDMNGNTMVAALNLITQAGAIVDVNGVNPSAAQGPYPVSGTTEWVSYTVPNVSGNLTITSTKSITAGIASGSDVVGYGGYFAGFSSVPVISKSVGNCVPGIILEVNAGFDSYQWMLENVAIPGATTSTYTPAQPGNYTCVVTNSTCPQVITPVYKVFNCPSNSTSNVVVCSVQQFNPAFTNSSQTVNNTSVNVTTPPTKGTAVVNPATGVITYTVNAGATGTDSFVYSFCSTTPEFFDCENVTVNITIGILTVNNAAIKACDTGNNTGVFNLTTPSLSADATAVKTYYTTLLDAQNDVIANQILTPNAYVSGPGTVYVKLITPLGCKNIAEIELSFYPKPNVNTSNFNASNCDNNLDGNIQVDFSTITPNVVNNSNLFVIKYYLNQVDATAGNANTLPNLWTYTTNTTVYIRVESTDGCEPAFGQINFVFANKIELIQPEINPVVCDVNFDGNYPVDLSVYNALITAEPTAVATYYLNFSDAQNSTNATNPIQTITTTTTYYVRYDSPSICSNIAKIIVGIGDKVALLNNGEINIKICDVNFNGSEEINLSDYDNQLTAVPGSVATYYTTLVDAQNNTNTISANQNITGNISYFVRFETNSLCPNIGKVNIEFSASVTMLNNGEITSKICDTNFNGSEDILLSDYINQLTTETGITTAYYATLADAQNQANPISVNQNVTTNTTYFLRFNKTGYCSSIAKLNLEFNNNISLINGGEVNQIACDDNFDGVVIVNLSTFISQLTTETGTTSTYYNSIADAQNQTNPIANTQNVVTNQSYFIRIHKNDFCDSIGKVNISIGEKLTVINNATSTKTICDVERNGQENVVLSDYIVFLTNEVGITTTYHNTMLDAQNNINPISVNQIITANKSFYMRFERADKCPNVATINLEFSQPNASTTLINQIICNDSLTTLDAGTGFTSYTWSTGQTTQSIQVGVGSYWVDLGSNSCTYRQNVVVDSEPYPTITNIAVNHTTVTITATGGISPYVYSLDGVNFQASNVFYNVPFGIQNVYVKSSLSSCSPVSRNTYIIQIPNVITPNGDGINDTIDYSKLGVMTKVKFEVFDRYGKQVYKNNNNTPVWDGKFEGKPLKTETYWYLLEWEDPNGYSMKYSGWILVKNRE